ncbi:g179 [Coccomyxa elongata]
MAVLLETSKGDIVVDLYAEECPLAARNFLKLCKIKYYNNVLFHNVQQNFIAQTGDPTGTGTGGDSIYGIMYGEQAHFFEDEIRPHLRHKKRGMVAMAGAGEDRNASQFYITLAKDLDSLDEKHTVFGEVSEGLEVLDAINEALCDDRGRPLQNIRIRHTILLDDPFPDPPQLAEHIPDASPEPVYAADDRLEDDWVPQEDGRSLEDIERETRQREAENRAVVLEMIGDLPEADAKPPSNMLFVCKLNPVTTEEDLEIIFSRFGNITSCDIIRDWKTGDSLCYAFIGFNTDEACEEAYFKMNNCLIDDRRIKVDFSQSVHHLWKQFRRHGKAGGAEEAAAAAEQGGQEARPAPRGRFELKPGAGRVYSGPAANGAHGRGYDLLLEGELDEPGPAGRAGHQNGHSHRGAHDGSKRSGNHVQQRDNRPEGSVRGDDYERHRDGPSSRERDRDRDRDRPRDRHRDDDRDRHKGEHREGREEGGSRHHREKEKHKEKKHKEDRHRDRDGSKDHKRRRHI